MKSALRNIWSRLSLRRVQTQIPDPRVDISPDDKRKLLAELKRKTTPLTPMEAFWLETEEKNHLSDTIWSVLDNAERYELLSLWPKSRARRGSSPEPIPFPEHGQLRDFAILGRVNVDRANVRGQVTDALRHGIEAWPHMHAGCMFQPRHAICASRGNDQLDILICFRCGIALAYLNEQEEKALLDNPTPPIFRDLLRAAKIPVEGEDRH